jgi:hypothetical protein
MRTRTRASCHRRGPSSSSGQHWSARDAGSRMALNVLIAVPRRHGFMSPHGHCLWARDCLKTVKESALKIPDARVYCGFLEVYVEGMTRVRLERARARRVRPAPRESREAGPARREEMFSPRMFSPRSTPPTPPPPHPGVILFGNHCKYKYLGKFRSGPRAL